MGMLGMLRHCLQQRLSKGEFNDEFLQLNIEAVNMKMSNKLAIEQFFDIGMLK
ncbi:7210_t:CDS:2 [Gigaspora margarita]|uniref:7210_t:CDS:1 n=1 Tax=Gigaspora margarita TaxID=4874 RepID=A0ABN7XA01_GIGMA|nr:7210_t:CDS:2 [Gigaspora margarita]